MVALKEIPVRDKGRFILGRVRHHVKKPLDYEVKVIHKGKLKVVSYGEDIFLVDDRLAEEAISRRWEEYVRERYRRPGSRAKKEIVEHPVELDVAFLRQILEAKKIFPHPLGEPVWISKKASRKSFLELCDELRAKGRKLPDGFKFRREKIHQERLERVK